MNARGERRRRVAIGVGVLLAVQTVIVLAYVTADGPPRRTSSSRFAIERVSGDIDMPAVVLERRDGTTWIVATLRPRPVVLHFWATWCRPCRDELPTLLAQRERIRGAGGELALVSVDDDWAAIRRFFGDAVPDEVSRAVGGDYRAITTGVLPETLIVDADGELTGRVRGARDWRTASAAAFLDSLE